MTLAYDEPDPRLPEVMPEQRAHRSRGNPLMGSWPLSSAERGNSRLSKQPTFSATSANGFREAGMSSTMSWPGTVGVGCRARGPVARRWGVCPAPDRPIVAHGRSQHHTNASPAIRSLTLFSTSSSIGFASASRALNAEYQSSLAGRPSTP